MVRKLAGISKSWDAEANIRRLRILREIVGARNQADFAALIGIEFKRWSNFERGYPVPREIAFLLHDKIPGFSIEWVWYGKTGNLPPEFRKKLDMIEQKNSLEYQRAEAIAEINRKFDALEKATSRKPRKTIV